MRPLRSITARLTLGFLAGAMAAVGVVLVSVLPQLESRLQGRALSTLASDAERFSGGVRRAVESDAPGPVLDRSVGRIAERSGARATLVSLSRGTLGPRALPVADSGDPRDLAALRFAVAVEAARDRRPTTGTEPGRDGRLGQAALPIGNRVLVLSEPLAGVEDDVAIVRRQVLVAGGLALLVAALVGLLVARALARRIRRLERTARLVAAGERSARFRVDARDELGQLAATLEEMRAQLAQLDEARSRFISTASHELRTPLFSLGGFVELLREDAGELDEETRRAFLDQLAGQVERLRALATELLDLGRLESGAMELHREPTDLAALARAVAREFDPALRGRDDRLELRLPSDGLEAVCDPDRVGQVLRILVDNAIAHTPAGTHMTLAGSAVDGRVLLSVRDDGPGIHRADADRVFEPFGRGTKTQETAQGSGLGLAIARELAELMDGALRLDSRPGRTTFTLELPR